MRILIKNKKTNQVYEVKKDTKPLKDEVLEEAKEKEKVEEIVEEVEDKKAQLTDEEISALKDLVKIIPDLKKLVDSEKDEDEEEDKEKEEEEDQEDLEGLEDTDEDVLLEETEENESMVDEDYEEEDVLTEEEDTLDSCDSKSSIGSIENKKLGDSNLNSKELEVANAFDLRYKNQLNKK